MKHLTKIQKEEIIKKHFEKGISQVQLAKEYGVSRQAINRYHCKPHGSSPALRSYNLDSKKVVKLYVEDKKSVLQIHKLLNVDRRAIRRILKSEGIIKKVSRRYKWQKEISHYALRLKIWNAKVIERDGMKCKWCKVENTRENRLEAHHIIPVRDITNPELLFDMKNGITICRKCHMKIHYHEKEYENFFYSLI